MCLIVLCFEWAEGRPVDFNSWEHMLNKDIAVAVARSLAKFHAISKRLPASIAGKVRNWRQLHDGLLSDCVVDPADEALAADPRHFGVLHGDVHSSNYFVIDGAGTSSSSSTGDDDKTAPTAATAATSSTCTNVFLFDFDRFSSRGTCSIWRR